MRYLLLLFTAVIITACHSGTGTITSKAITVTSAIPSSDIVIDSSTQIPVFAQPTHIYTFVHNESSKAINGITYFVIGNKEFKLDNPDECQMIAANQKCKLWFTTPSAQPGEDGSAFIEATYNINGNQQQAFASNILNYSYTNPAQYSGVAFLNELYATGHYGLVYFFAGNTPAQAVIKPINSNMSVLDKVNQISVSARQIYPVEVSVETGANSGLQVMSQLSGKSLKSDFTNILNVQSISPNTRGAYLVMSAGKPMNARFLESSTITIMNLGNESATSISVSPPAGLAHTTTCPNILNSGNACTIKLQTTGQIPGNGSLNINYNYSGGARSAIQNIYWYNPSEYPYILANYNPVTKSTALNASSTTIVTITNIGGYKLTSLIESGSAPSNGTVSINTIGSSSPCGSSLDVNASCSFNVQITGTATTSSAVKAIFTISGNYQSASGQQTISLKQVIPFVVTNNFFVAVGNAPAVVTTTNGSIVNPVVASGNLGAPRTMYFVDNYFYSVTFSGDLLRSPDGVNIQTIATGLNGPTMLKGGFPSQMAGNGSAMILTGGNSILCSSDRGVTWNNVLTPDAGNTTVAVAYGNGKFIVAGTNGQMWAGTNCESSSWAAVNGSTITDTINSGIYANGYFVFVANSGKIIYSTTGDANSWAAYSGTTTDNLISVVYANNKFTVLGRNSTSESAVFYNSISNSPANWQSPYTAPTIFRPRGPMAFGNSYYAVMAEASSSVYYSPTALNASWVTVPSANIPGSGGGLTGAGRGIAFGNNTFALANSTGINYSKLSPPSTWPASYTDQALYAVVKYDSNNAYAVGQNGVGYNINFGSNPVILTQKTVSVTSDPLTSIAANGTNQFVALQVNGNLWWSRNPNTDPSWTRNTQHGVVWFSIATAGAGPAANKWVIVGAGGCGLWYMTDFESIVANGVWRGAACPSGGAATYNKVIWTGSQYVAVGDGGKVISSSSGASWFDGATISNAPVLKDIAYCSPNWVTVGTNTAGTEGVIYSASPNITSAWIQRGTGLSLPPLTGISCSGANFVATAANGNVYSSLDGGNTWTQGTLSYSPVPLNAIFFK